MLDVIIEKGKGPVLGKLRTIQLIEADLQLVMKILVNNRNKHNIESDIRIAKSNYGSRPRYSIDNAILEKCLIYDNSLLSRKQTIYNIIDLQACYDQQLDQIGSIVQESIGVKRKAIKLIAKLILVMEYYLCTSYGVSSNYYGGYNNKQSRDRIRIYSIS